MFRLYSVKAASRRWPVQIFYGVIDMALIKSWVIYKAVCKSNISRRVYIQKVCEELTGSFNGAMELLTFGRPMRFGTASSATRKLKKKVSVTAGNSLLQKTAAHVLVNCAEIKQLTSLWCVKARYVKSVAANDACRVCNKARYLAML